MCYMQLRHPKKTNYINLSFIFSQNVKQIEENLDLIDDIGCK